MSGTQNAGKLSAHEGGQRAVQGAELHGRGAWGVSPHKFKRGRVANPGNPATSGAQYAGKP